MELVNVVVLDVFKAEHAEIERVWFGLVCVV